jgi:predicted nucleotidyltransferase
MTFDEILHSHSSLESRRQNSENSLSEIRKHFSATKFFDDKHVSVFTAGSFGRRDAGKNSDLDLFVVSEQEKRSRLSDLEILAKLIQINGELNYPPFSNDGQYLKVYSIADMKNKAGDSNDDSENLFTARLLFLLESAPLCNEVLYQEHLKAIVEHYFREYPEHKPFSPLFLLNDILRYWRTLCLNYERIRNDRKSERPWRKKNINLKFSRMLTVFATVLPLIALPVCTPEDLISLVKKVPLQRLALGLDALADNSLEKRFTEFLDDYEQFLSWKEQDDVEKVMQEPDMARRAKETATRFSDFLYTALTHEKIPIEFRKFLVI